MNLAPPSQHCPSVGPALNPQYTKKNYHYDHFRLEVPGSENIRRRKSVKRVSRACVNCSRAHAACDHKRPCSRCVRKGMESSCADVTQKKRGRKKTFSKSKNTSPKENSSPTSVVSSPESEQSFGNNNNSNDKKKSSISSPSALEQLKQRFFQHHNFNTQNISFEGTPTHPKSPSTTAATCVVQVSGEDYIEVHELQDIISNALTNISLASKNNVAKLNQGMFISRSLPFLDDTSPTVTSRWSCTKHKDIPKTWFELLHSSAKPGAYADLLFITSSELRKTVGKAILQTQQMRESTGNLDCTAVIKMDQGPSLPGAAFRRQIANNVLQVTARTLGQDRRGSVFEYVRECYIVYDDNPPHRPKMVISYMMW